MRVNREFEDPELVRQLESFPEAMLRSRIERPAVTSESFLAALGRAQDAAKEAGMDGITEEEIQAEVNAARHERRRRDATDGRA